MNLTKVQRTVLERTAAGEALRWELGKGLRVGDRPVRYGTVSSLRDLGLLEVVPHGPEDNRIDYTITAAGFEALGIKLGTGTTEGMVPLDKPITSCLYILGLGLIDLPEMKAEDQANLLAIVRKNVPDFGHRPEYLESGIVDLGDQAVLVLSTADEPTYMAVFCEDMATALAIVNVFAEGEGLTLAAARRFDPDGTEHPMDLGAL